MKPLSVNWPPPGRYLLAVSGGADSMGLLSLMTQAAGERGYELIVAHFDHGLRPNSTADRQFVQAVATRLGLPFVFHAAKLGQASEATARAARHAWLEHTRATRQAAAVITGHHQDDLIETSLLNLARGSRRRGLAPMQSGPILRPLLGLSRPALRDYATAHHLTWREDPTNARLTNPRNFARHKLLSQAGPEWRARYLELIARLTTLNKKVDQSLSTMLTTARTEPKAYSFPRPQVQELSLPELEELLVAAALSLRPDLELDQRLIQEIALFAKTGRPHKQRPLRLGLILRVEPTFIRLTYT